MTRLKSSFTIAAIITAIADMSWLLAAQCLPRKSANGSPLL